MLLILEDLHWAGAATLDHVAALADLAARAPVVLVTTSRSDADPLTATWHETTGAATMFAFDVGPLRPVDASALAAQLADKDDVFTRRCLERATGNPLFLEHLLLAGQTSVGDLPAATVQIVVQSRLDRLAPAERGALRVASVLGQRFALAALDHLLDSATWDPQRTRGLLRIEGTEGQFAHALVRDGAYASLPRARRRELHARAARWFEARDVVLRAEHLEAAEDPVAPQAMLEAARAEAAAHRHERACALAGRGLSRVATGSVRFALACTEAQSLLDLGSTAEAQASWLQALAAAPDDVERCMAWIGVASTHRMRDELDAAARALETAETWPGLRRSTRPSLACT